MQHLLTLLSAFFLLFSATSTAQTVNPLIRIDQFGYLENSKKVAVLSDPQTGFNAIQAYAPGSTFELRRTGDNTSVWSGSPISWKTGSTHTQSGDKGWWLDFSSVETPGEYYLYDVQNQVRSHPFRIGNDCYKAVLKQAVRVFFYQRLGYEKTAAFAGDRWTDGASYLGANQDPAARSRWAKNDPATARDLRGGWMDAGDVNKYTTFAEGPVLQLLQAYQDNPTVFTDDFNIPESGNGIPDLLDEVKWELDFFKRCQDATGTNGFVLKVGVDNYNEVSPLSLDTRPRYYLPECTSATLAGAAMFSLAGIVYQQSNNADLQAYGADLIQRAAAAWARGKDKTGNFQNFESACDDGDIKSGDADREKNAQMESAVIAAIYLYEATDETQYREFVEARLPSLETISTTWWGPYKQFLERAMLEYATLPGVGASTVQLIRNQKANMNYQYSLDDYTAQKDLYRAFMEDWAHHWGSNLVRANCGSLNMDFIQFQINPANTALYREVAEQYLHWLHGTNPLGMSMLSNMYNYGGDACVDEIYHTWFANGTVYDNALTSPKGPPPGYVTGGPNKDFSYAQLSPPANQPPQKAYLQFNSGWPESSWEITEPAIYYQAAYILLLSRLMPAEMVSSTTPSGKENWISWVTPNPMTSQVTITIDCPKAESFRVEVVNSQGQTVRTQTYSCAPGANQLRFDLNDWTAGMYMVRCSNGNGIQVHKLIKQ